ncbi:MAG: hypothetical protein PUD93_06180 [Lachnospiraceae bacterium]|nr:hypothetical protein [Lachnospiraceae bacterium]
MEERKTIFDYLGQIFIIFGITMAILCVFCILFGESAKEYSGMFAFGNEGLNVATMGQFFLVSICVVGLRFVFFTDAIIKKMSVTARTVWMVSSVILLITVFILAFHWFPADMWEAWAMFLICFGICFAISMTVTIIKERMENRRMEEALERVKKQNEKK